MIQTKSKTIATLNCLSEFNRSLFVEFNWLCILAPLGPLECSPGSSLSVQAPLGRPPHSPRRCALSPPIRDELTRASANQRRELVCGPRGTGGTRGLPLGPAPTTGSEGSLRRDAVPGVLTSPLGPAPLIPKTTTHQKEGGGPITASSSSSSSKLKAQRGRRG